MTDKHREMLTRDPLQVAQKQEEIAARVNTLQQEKATLHHEQQELNSILLELCMVMISQRKPGDNTSQATTPHPW